MKKIIYLFILSLILFSCKQEADIIGTWNFSSTSDSELNILFNQNGCVFNSYIEFFEDGSGDFHAYDNGSNPCDIEIMTMSWTTINEDNEYNITRTGLNWNGTQDSIYNFSASVDKNNLTIKNFIPNEVENFTIDGYFNRQD